MSENENRVNIPLLRKAVEWVEAEAAKPPELCEWEQRLWNIPPDTDDIYGQHLRANRAPECGTTYCVAGYIGQLVDPRYAETVEVDGVHIEEVAGAALGLQPLQHHLFFARNTAEDVRRIAEEIAGEPL